MYAAAAYIHSRYVELALGELEKIGIQSQILAVPLDKPKSETMPLVTALRTLPKPG
ncbi:MAG: hypothetical protein HPY50_04845 [Firmicutes bacterium]|nr:hypothetical protein [Bacillota bacterium]